ncbi:MAG TPA: polysaccharide deacetylase family protein [Thermoanaerobaculaceae bacterium]|nr:polysaccharide deacetylase family protein [Thermoanaerobaculaceae bacterium]
MGFSHKGDRHALTVDVEDWHNATILQCTGRVEPPTTSVVRNTLALLELLGQHQAKATWFFLGEVAEAFPELVRKVAEAGHEVGVHGFHHHPLHKFDAPAFKAQIARARTAVEQSAGKRVLGHRGVDFSLRKETEWALDVLAELGFLYDATLFPVRTPRYGVSGAPLDAHRVALRDGRHILEIPVSVADPCGVRIPFAGGGYFRMLPLAVTRSLFSLTARRRPVVFYLHPCEIEPESELGYLPDELSEQEKGMIRRCFRSESRGRAQGARKLRVLLSKYRFDTIENVFLGGGMGELTVTTRKEDRTGHK